MQSPTSAAPTFNPQAAQWSRQPEASSHAAISASPVQLVGYSVSTWCTSWMRTERTRCLVLGNAATGTPKARSTTRRSV
jgi:hypothetical protein